MKLRISRTLVFTKHDSGLLTREGAETTKYISCRLELKMIA
jgi:hypothetical protein